MWSVDVVLPFYPGFDRETDELADTILTAIDAYGGGAVAISQREIDAGFAVEADDAAGACELASRIVLDAQPRPFRWIRVARVAAGPPEPGPFADEDGALEARRA